MALTAAPSLPPTPGLRRAAHLLGRALRERALQLSARNQHDCGKQAKAGHAVGGVQLNRVLRSARGGARRCAPRRRLHVGLRRRGAAAPIVAMALAPGADDRNQEATCYVGDQDAVSWSCFHLACTTRIQPNSSGCARPIHLISAACRDSIHRSPSHGAGRTGPLWCVRPWNQRHWRRLADH